MEIVSIPVHRASYLQYREVLSLFTLNWLNPWPEALPTEVFSSWDFGNMVVWPRVIYAISPCFSFFVYKMELIYSDLIGAL